MVMGWIRPVGWVVGFILVGLFLRELFHHAGPVRTAVEKSPFSVMYLAVFMAAFYGGPCAGTCGVTVCLGVIYWELTRHRLMIADDWLRLIFFIVVSALVSEISRRARHARSDANRAFAQRDRSEEHIGTILDSLPEAFVLLDRDWRFLYMNRACERMYDMKRESSLGTTLWEGFPQLTGSMPEQEYRRAMGQRVPVQFETLSPSLGFWVESGAFPVAGGISIYVQDIDARKKVELALRESEARYRRLVETAHEGIWTIDAESKTSYVNRAMAEMLGYTTGEMLGRPMFDFMDDTACGEAEQNVAKRQQGVSERHEFRFRRKDGTDFFANLSTNPILGDKGEYQGALAMVSDITDRRRAEMERSELLSREQKARAEAETANRRKDQFLAVLSHELRTPLTPVLARLELMKREPNLSNAFKSGLQMIRRNVELEARLIDDLLDLTRLARGQLKLRIETIDAHDKILAALEIYQGEITARSQTIILQLDAVNHHVNADAVRLQQIFWNMLGNAVKYTPEGGRIEIHTSVESVNGSPSILQVRFRDDGIGMEADMMHRLFDPFEQGEQTLTRRFGGLGIGLSISRTLVEMQGGTISAASDGKGRGSTFTVSLPAVPAPPVPLLQPDPGKVEEPLPGATSPQTAVRRILLVDDNQDTLRVIARLLRLNGHQVVTAESVSSAITAAAEPFDLLITDIGLPDGTGWELMRELRRRGPVRAIALSGFSMDDDIRRSREVGFIEHLCKPIMPDDLEQAILRAAAI